MPPLPADPYLRNMFRCNFVLQSVWYFILNLEHPGIMLVKTTKLFPNIIIV